MQSTSQKNNSIDNISCVRFFNVNKQAKIRLFCFHYAGGNISTFSNWHQRLPADVEVCGILLPGRLHLSQHQPIIMMPELINYLVRQLLPYIDERPFVFFGHSLGGLIAFELAYALQNIKLPKQIFISGCCSPREVRNTRRISHLPDSQLIQRLKEYNGTPVEILDSPELMQLLLPIIRADFSLNENYHYQPRPPLNCPVVIYGGIQDAEVNTNDLQNWQLETLFKLQLRLFSGDHFYIDKQKSELLAQFRQDLFRS